MATINSSRKIQIARWLMRAAILAVGILYVTLALEILSTPEGDKDAHAHVALAIVFYGSPVAMCFAVAGLVGACVARTGVKTATLVAVLAVTPILLLGALLAGWL